MVQLFASHQHVLPQDTLSGASGQALASNLSPVVAAVAPVSAPTTIDGGTFGSGPDTLVLTLSEDAFQGDAQANVTIDGKMLTAQPITVTALHMAAQIEDFTFKGNFSSGAHNLGMSFINDAHGGTSTTDRNLYLDGASYDGISSRPSAAVFQTAGTMNFTIPPADDPEATPTVIDGGTFGSGPDTLVLTLTADAYQGNAMANVAIDGQRLTAQPITVTAVRTAGQSEEFTFKGNFGLTAHDLAVSFLNDAYGGTPTTDRNLYMNAASYDGITPRPATAVFYSAGTQHFTIPPAGDPETAHSAVAALIGH